ncbi:unnamed protein product [Parascedosporium putredinis]|uniref:Uncharacterized protein n=1 Tax=Parascedosporium putredinis TaxID=1442378 RepID=A0A9P1MBD9_9PEZI|nr:unnamed protein product [Parascedosporium putredinis]CAI7999377.1 unnamed protein product [Parascedosporium putredinis]
MENTPNLSESISGSRDPSTPGKQLERKTADAALTRALLGREEAESDARRSRDEVKSLKRTLDESRDREKKVSERMEQVMDQYVRLKEMHQHTQSIWEKEIRRQRKEYFKAHSVGVRHAEELKLAKESLRSAESSLVKEKERSRAREQEAFKARYQIVGVQEQLDQALEKIKVVEQERDAFKTLAKNEEDEDDEFASPRKRPRLSVADVVSSAASEQEIEDLAMKLSWEKQRADRAQEKIDFLVAECELRCCPCAKSAERTGMLSPRRIHVAAPVEILDSADLAILRQRSTTPDEDVPELPPLGLSRAAEKQVEEQTEEEQAAEQEAEEADAYTEPPTPVEAHPNPPKYARTPSVDPPSFALLAQERTSLLSLLNAPHEETDEDETEDMPTIPTMPDEQANRDGGDDAIYENSSATLRAEDDGEELAASAAAASAAFTRHVRSRSRAEDPSFDALNPALTPTMTREQALAQIRERRGRARSAAQGAVTPRRQMVKGVDRRDMSAPTGRLASKARTA